MDIPGSPLPRQGSSPQDDTVAAGPATVSFSGDLDLTTSSRFRDQLVDLIARRPSSLIVDLTDVTFLCSRGLAVLLETVTNAHAHGIPCAIIATHHAVLRPIRALGLDRVLPIHLDHAAAETSLSYRHPVAAASGR